MSHFSVLVVTDAEPTTEILTAALQPFHEFECTGTDDKYVVDVDMTDERRAEYEAAKTKRVRLADGTVIDRYDPACYRNPTDEEVAKHGPFLGTGCGGGLVWCSQDWKDGLGYRAKIHEVPAGAVEFEEMTKDVQSFAFWLTDYHGIKTLPSGVRPHLGDVHKYGYAALNAKGEVVKVVKRTNPNKHWDWWVVGGRWTGLLAAGYDAEKDPANFETCFICHGGGLRTDELGRAARLKDPGYTCNGCGGTGKSLKHPAKFRPIGNSAMVAAIDLKKLKADAVAHRQEQIDRMIAKGEFSGIDALEAARTAYLSAHAEWVKLPEPRPKGDAFAEFVTSRGGLAALRYRHVDFLSDIPRDAPSAAEWIAAAPALTTYAVVKDGQWFERGKMGWWGVSTDEVSPAEWQDRYEEMLAGLRPDQWITIVDCHI